MLVFFSLTSCSLNPLKQLNQLRLCLLHLSTAQLLRPNEHATVEQQGYNLRCLSPSFSLGKLHTAPCWTPERRHLFSWGCNIKGSWVLTELSCFHTHLFPATGTHPHPGSQPAEVRHHGQRPAQQQESKMVRHLLLAIAQANHPTSPDLTSSFHKQTWSFHCFWDLGRNLKEL